MPQTLSEILIAANSMVDLDAALPTGQELTLRTEFANRAVLDAAAVAQFKEFKNIYEVAVTTSSVTVSLPTDFREFQTLPQISSGSSWEEFEQIRPEDKYKRSTGDRYCYVLGTPEDYNLILNAPIDGTLSIVYQKFPRGFATLTDVCELPDPVYVSTKIEALVLQGRSDDRFTIVNSQAEQRLANMVGREMKTVSGGINTTPQRLNPLR